MNFFSETNDDGIEIYQYYRSAGDGYVNIVLQNGGDGDWKINITNYEKFNDNTIMYQNEFTFLKVHQFQNILDDCKLFMQFNL